MTIEQANELLDSIKDGNTYASIKSITEALWQTGDLGLPENLRASDLDGIHERGETIRLGQSKET